MSRQLPRLIDSQPAIQHRPFWRRVPAWAWIVVVWVIVYFVTVLAMKGFYG